jgi:hypothetical protein
MFAYSTWHLTNYLGSTSIDVGVGRNFAWNVGVDEGKAADT